MVPSLEDNQYIIINKIGYIVGDPHRGDVVVFRPPSDNSKYYVKRIIGVPGDEISIRDGKIFLATQNGEQELSDTDQLTDRELDADANGYAKCHKNGDAYHYTHSDDHSYRYW